MPYFPSSSSSACLNPVHSHLSCDKIGKTVVPKIDEDSWDACSSLHSPSTSQSVTALDQHEEPTSLRSNIIKWREGISLGYPDCETLEYWELIGPLSSSPLFMTTSPSCTSFPTTPPSSPRHASTVSFQPPGPGHILHSALGSLYNVREQSQEDLEIRQTLIGSGCSDDECSRSDCDTDCTVVDNSGNGLGILPNLFSYLLRLMSRTSTEI
ncbi:hypothetical protein EDD18DRAFT_1151190 [Armillaria luteobubalina]|uniref:Uncharacterized protein n=1 Tax=Armillaria luteobubalina TaxID=153913 RepID=A0AA39UQV2_9AGAR|nr:hypothetical protein EDD18DRAFT_1151190 [Armillaria luteobubalina]